MYYIYIYMHEIAENKCLTFTYCEGKDNGLNHVLSKNRRRWQVRN